MELRVLALLAGLATGCSAPTGSGGASGSDSTSGTGASAATTAGTATATSDDPSTSSTGTTGSTTSGDTGGCLPGPTGGDLPETCDVWAQDCPCGSKCMAYASDPGATWDGMKCVPIATDPKGLYEPCTVEGSWNSGVDDCGAGLLCWHVNPETNTGVCVGMCMGSDANPTCEDPNAACRLKADGFAIPCVEFCDPLTPDCPNPADLCVPDPFGAGFVCVLDAGQEGMGNDGDPCEFANVCAPTLYCAEASSLSDCAGSSGCCTPFCDLQSPLGHMQCPNHALGEACVPWYANGEAPPKLQHVGSCILGD